MSFAYLDLSIDIAFVVLIVLGGLGLPIFLLAFDFLGRCVIYASSAVDF